MNARTGLDLGIPFREREGYRRPVEFRVLGAVEVVQDGDGAVSLGGPKQRAILAHLLLRANNLVPAEVLIDEVWGEEPPETVRNSLQTHASHLRKALGPGRLEGSRAGYVLRADPSEVDAHRFQSLLRDARRLLPIDPKAAVAAFDDALSLWRGPAFGDLAGEPSIGAEASRLDELRLGAIEDRIEALLTLGEHGQVIGELETLTARHPLRERSWGQLMLALYRAGRQAEALAAFQRARDVLAEELGIDPSPELRKIHERILQQSPDLDVGGAPLRGYRLLERVGVGSFGTVWRAIQPEVGRDVAVKAIHPHLVNDPDFIRRFEAEAQLIARLEHPHVVPLYDYWREPDGAYLVMRFLRGGSLADALATGPIEIERVALLLDQVGSALAAAHSQGVVHRDVKPGNILLDEEGNAYLADFGIAKDLSATERTETGAIKGSLLYVAPEQIRGDTVTPTTDLYALGFVLFEAIVGEHPFEDVPDIAVLERQMHAPIPSAIERRADLPPAVDEVIARATAKDPELRFPDALSMAGAFRTAIASTVPVARSQPPQEARNPYKGLRPFVEADAQDFFGREAFVERLLQRWRRADRPERFLAVVGPSGSGKSSAVRAGLVPALRGGAVEGSEGWFVTELVPGPHPMEELEAALLRVAAQPPAGLLQLLESGPRGLVQAIDRLIPDGIELVLVVDQFEEAFTLTEEEGERSLLLESLRVAAADPASRARIVATLRADFYDRPLNYPRFGELLGANTEVVTALAPEELERAIVRPAESVGLRVEPALVAQVASDVAEQPGALPLVQYALTELFDHRDDGRLTLSAYRDIGGVGGALAARAEHLYLTRHRAGQEAVRQLFLRLVTLGEGVADTRRRVPLSELSAIEVDPEAMQAALDAFGRHRLLTFDRDPATREPTVEVAHEALLRSWPRLRGWIGAARDDVRTLRRLADAARDWERNGREPSFLLRGSRLDQFESWAEGSDLAVGRTERAYLHTSVIDRQEEREAEAARGERERAVERRSGRRLRALVAVFGAAALVAGSLTVVARNQSERAGRESRIAIARELAAAAVANLDMDAERSLLLALEAVETTYRVDRTSLPEAEEALHRALQAYRLVLTVPGLSGQFGADGSRLLVAGLEPGRADVYEPASGERISTAIGAGSGSEVGPGGGLDLAFSADGGLFATAGESGDVRLYETETGEEVRRLSVPEGALYDPEFSPDGRFISTGGPVRGCCPETYLFDLRTGELLNIDFAIGPVAFSPDGQRRLIADSWFDPGLDEWVAGYVDDSQERRGLPDYPEDFPFYHLPGQEADVPIYEGLVGGERLRGMTLLGGHEGDVNDAAWSPDGAMVVTSSPKQVSVWDVSRSKPVRDPGPEFSVSPPAGLFTAVDFGPDSQIATGMSDGTTVLWRLSRDDAEAILTLAGHGAEVADVDFSPDGTRLVTSSDDGNVRLWDITPEGGHELLTLAGSGGLAYSPDGSLIAVGSEDGDVRLYEAESGERTTLLRGHEGRINAIAFHPSGSTLATAGFSDGTARIWDATSGIESAAIDLVPSNQPARLCELYPSRLEQVFDIAFSPDGDMLLTGGWFAASSTLIWDPTTGELERILAQGSSSQDQWGRSVDFSPDGRLVAGEGWDSVFVWAVDDAQIVAQIPEQQVNALAFSPDGRSLVTGSLEGGVKVWEARTGRQLGSMTGNVGKVLDLAFSPEGEKLATSSSDGAVRLWDLGTGRQILTLASGVAGEVGAESKFCFRTNRVAYLGVGGKLAFSPDGTRLAYTAADGTVRVLALDVDDLIDLARSRLTRSWTQEECRTYLHVERCPPTSA
ncbi:MAG: protein kinase [Actinobacteria bacterium]|nr:protein kinase [Actinomycetota bacterium]